MTAHRFDVSPARPAWITTLADLALLLVGFFVFLQATRLDGTAVAAGIRAAFDGTPAATMPVEEAVVEGFIPGAASAAVPPAVLAWTEAAATDPRVTITVQGASDDGDDAHGASALIAIDRARAVAAALLDAHALRPDQLRFAPPATGTRAVRLSAGFAGNRQETAAPTTGTR